MSTAGFNDANTAAIIWDIWYGKLSYVSGGNAISLRPVINLKVDVIATGSGTSADPYVIQ